MYQLVSYKIVYPSFTVQQIATPISGTTNNPLYNTTSLQTIPLVVLPSGGKYSFQFDQSTFLELTLGTFVIQQTSVYPTELNQDSFYQQSYNTSQPFSSTSAVTGFKVTRQTTETLYIEGDSFTIDTTNISDSQIVTVSLPTYTELQVGLEAYNSAFNTNVSLIYPSNSFYTNSNVINPQNWNVTSPFGIQYSVSVSPVSGVMYTVGYNIVDLYGNLPNFTINNQNLPNSAFNSTPTVNEDYIPELPVSSFSNVNPIQMIPDSVYNYGNFSSLGYSDGILSTYPVFFKEQVQYTAGVNSNNQYVYDILLALSLFGTKKGIQPYGLMLGSQPLGGYTINLMYNPFLAPAQSSNVSATLQSNANILPTLLSSTTGSIGGVTAYGSSNSASSTTTTTSTNTTTNTTTTTTTNVNKTNINLVNLLTSPLAVLVIILALIGVILFIAI